MSKFSKLKVGEVLSEAQYYKVVKIVGDKAQLVNDHSENIVVDNKYVDNSLISASQFEKEEKVNKTELATIFISNPSVVMETNFNKKVDEKEVLAQVMSEISNAKLSDIEKAVKAAIKKSINGEPRTMIGRHFGDYNELGRVNFIDMNEVKDPNKEYDSRQRQVDPRTLNYIILKGVKYSLK